jgi:hypothetical protein
LTIFGRSREERGRLERIIERLLNVIDKLLEEQIASKGELKIMPSRIVVGGKGATATYKELGQDGVTIIPPKGPVTFASDSPAFATVDGANQVKNADGSVSAQVTAVAANADGTDSSAVISAVDPLTGLAGADKLTVGAAAVVQVPTSASLTLSAN